MNPDATIQRLCEALPDLRQRFAVAPVSYTHLTLPTN